MADTKKPAKPASVQPQQAAKPAQPQSKPASACQTGGKSCGSN